MKTVALTIALCLVFGICTVEAASAWGTKIGTFNAVDAYSNGSTGYLGPPGTYGHPYQCVEYVNRYYVLALGHQNMKGTGNANSYYSTASSRGLRAYPNGGPVIPQPGDILCSNGGTYGHVAIVRAVTSNSVHVIQQNWHNDNRDNDVTLTMDISNGNCTVSGFSASYPVHGWLRKSTSQAISAQITQPSQGAVITSNTVTLRVDVTQGKEQIKAVKFWLHQDDGIEQGNNSAWKLSQTEPWNYSRDVPKGGPDWFYYQTTWDLTGIADRCYAVTFWAITNDNQTHYGNTVNFCADLERVSKPGTPTGKTDPVAGTSYQYSTTGAANSLGHTLEYQFDWGDGQKSGWSVSKSASHSWSSSGAYSIKVTARCQTHTSEKSTSDALTVSVQPPTPTLVAPNNNSHQICNITFRWNSISGATKYKLWVKIPGSSSWVSVGIWVGSVRLKANAPVAGRRGTELTSSETYCCLTEFQYSESSMCF